MKIFLKLAFTHQQTQPNSIHIKTHPHSDIMSPDIFVYSISLRKQAGCTMHTLVPTKLLSLGNIL